MEEKNSDIKSKSNSAENSNPRVGNFRPGSSNSNPRPGSSNGNSRPTSTSSHWQEKDRKHPKKRPQPEDDDLGRDSKGVKKESPDKVKKENSENDPNENSNENPIMSLHEIAIASQRMAVATLSQQSQQQMAVAMPQQQIMHQQPISYAPFGYNPAETYMDPNQGAYAVNHFPPIMPMNSQWPVSNTMPAAASSVASTSGIGMSNSLEMVSPANGAMTAYPYMNIGNNDGSLYGMVPGMPVYQYPVVNNNVDTTIPMFNNLEPITITNAVLTPPLPGERRSRRQKPLGCRTVFVGNLPEKITEDMIKEAFKVCGPISVVRMSKKNFCHIRFTNMESVDQALLLSGFRIRIEENEDPAYNGRLHVDYAVARDDQHDHECLERAKLREERHLQKTFRPPSPPPIPHYSDHEAQSLTDRLRNEDTLKEGIQVLVTWLDRGECNKRNSGTFYSLIQSSYSHVKRLRNEKSKCEEEVEKAKENSKNKNRSIEFDINDIEKVFVAAKPQKVWDHFTRSQRKKMEEMKNDTEDLKKINSLDLVDERVEVEMDCSDTEERNDNEVNGVQQLQAEEIAALHEKLNAKDEVIDGYKKEVGALSTVNADQADEILRLKMEMEEMKNKDKIKKDSPVDYKDQVSFNDNATQCSPMREDPIEHDILILTLIAIFLHVHPFGASIDYICSFLVKIISYVNARDIESLLNRHLRLFKEIWTGIGATLEKKWTYIGFRYRH